MSGLVFIAMMLGGMIVLGVALMAWLEGSDNG